MRQAVKLGCAVAFGIVLLLGYSQTKEETGTRLSGQVGIFQHAVGFRALWLVKEHRLDLVHGSVEVLRAG